MSSWKKRINFNILIWILSLQILLLKASVSQNQLDMANSLVNSLEGIRATAQSVQSNSATTTADRIIAATQFLAYVPYLGPGTAIVSSIMSISGFGKKKSNSLDPQILSALNRISHQISELADYVRDMKQDLISTMNQMSADIAKQNIDQDINLLYALNKVWSKQPDSFFSYQTICGQAVENCNLAYINLCENFIDFMSAQSVETSSAIDESTGIFNQMIPLLASSKTTLAFLNSFYLTQQGVNIANSTAEEIGLLTHSDLFSEYLNNTMLRGLKFIDNTYQSADLNTTWTVNSWLNITGPTLIKDFNLISAHATEIAQHKK